jgi:haloalkane dehalogenase
MGRSEKLSNGGYNFLDHAQYLDEWFSDLGLKNVHLVVHDWGSALGFYWAFRNAGKVRSLTYMEAIVQPRKWADFPPGRDVFFRDLRSKKGEAMIFDDNFFIETILPKSILRTLSPEEMAAYRKPFEKREDRLPTLLFPRQMPIEGEPAEVVRIVARYGDWLSKSDIPKLLIVAKPGSLLVGPALAFCRTWPNQKEITVKGIHFIQEDSPNEIGLALSGFLHPLTGE